MPNENGKLLVSLDGIDVINTTTGEYGAIVSFTTQENGRLLVRSDEPAKDTE